MLIARNVVDHKVCIVMDRCDMSLHQLLHEHDCTISLDQLDQAGVILRGVARGVQLLHSRRIIHRDIKPNNVLLCCDGSNVKLADSGLAKIKSAGATASTATAGHKGTYAYMAPELFDAKPRWTKAADVYAYAVIAWETILRALPWTGLRVVQLAESVREEAP
jgi:serine/threonine protein kinase